MRKILVTGVSGQLGSEIRFLSDQFPQYEFVFTDRGLPDANSHLDISKRDAVMNFCIAARPDFIINCAAYTAVDKAESDREAAFSANAQAPVYLAEAALEINARLIHISTDFVFEGNISRPLTESDPTGPLSVYGQSKLDGETGVMKVLPEAVIIRTGWVYSSYGNNFVKTILRLCRERSQLNVIFDQVGTPTYARDLAMVILQIASQERWQPGLYHFSNEGVCSWYDFARAIRDFAGLETLISPIETSQYPTPAARPGYSVLNKKKVKETYGIDIPYWRDSLGACMKLLK